MPETTERPRTPGGHLRIAETPGGNVSSLMEGCRSILSLMAQLTARHMEGEDVAVVFNADSETNPGGTFLYGPPVQLRRLIAELTQLADKADALAAERSK